LFVKEKKEMRFAFAAMCALMTGTASSIKIENSEAVDLSEALDLSEAAPFTVELSDTRPNVINDWKTNQFYCVKNIAHKIIPNSKGVTIVNFGDDLCVLNYYGGYAVGACSYYCGQGRGPWNMECKNMPGATFEKEVCGK
jgi:hypothetical protein